MCVSVLGMNSYEIWITHVPPLICVSVPSSLEQNYERFLILKMWLRRAVHCWCVLPPRNLLPLNISNKFLRVLFIISKRFFNPARRKRKSLLHIIHLNIWQTFEIYYQAISLRDVQTIAAWRWVFIITRSFTADGKKFRNFHKESFIMKAALSNWMAFISGWTSGAGDANNLLIHYKVAWLTFSTCQLMTIYHN